MRSIHFAKTVNFCQALDTKLFMQFMSDKRPYMLMWQDQGLGFWIKFVINVHTFLKLKLDELGDKEMIVFLKALTDKRFEAVVDYIKAAHQACKEHGLLAQELSPPQPTELLRSIQASEVEKYRHLHVSAIKVKCAGSFVRLLPFWQEAPEGNDFAYSPPEDWSIPVTVANPLEAFIRFKFAGRRDIEDILGCKLEEIGWWNAPAKKVDQSKLKSTPADKSTSKQQVEKSKELKKPKTFWRPDFKPCFVFTQMAFQADTYAKGIYKIKTLLEMSFPPFMEKKFHVINAAMLDEGDVSKSFMGSNPWYMLVSESLSIDYFQFLQQVHSEGVKILPCPRRSKRIVDWHEMRDFDKAVLKNLHDRVGSAQELKDSVEELSEFILEPCILIQLPWEYVLFRQWLAAAQIEILKFELETVELRHWPIPEELEPTVSKMLHVVSVLKERIILGWALVGYASTHPEQCKDIYPNTVFDHIVLPSIAPFNFICSKKMRHMIESIKKLAWVSNRKPSLSGKVNVAPEAYTENPSMAELYLNTFGHFIFWETFPKNPSLFYYYHDEHPRKTIEEKVGLISARSNESLTRSGPFFLSPLKQDEKMTLKVMEETDLVFYTRDDSNKIAYQIVKKITSACKHLTGEQVKKLTCILDSDETKEIASKIMKTTTPQQQSTLEQLLLSSLIYHYTEKRIAQLSNKGILNCMVLLSARVMAKEQLVRIFAAISMLLDDSPRVCTLEPGKCSLDCAVSKTRPLQMSEIMSTVNENQESKPLTREELFSTFPEEWRKPVKNNLPVPSIANGIEEAIAILEVRVGRMVWNTAQENFNTKEKGRYHLARLVHYMLPCYIACLVEAAKYPNTPRDNKKKELLLLFVTSLISEYENYYTAYFSGKLVQEKFVITDETDMRIRRASVIANYLGEQSSFVLHAFTGLGSLIRDSSTMPHLKNLFTVIMEFPMALALENTSQIEFFNYNTWYNMVFDHFKVMHKICYLTLPVPRADTLLYCHELQDLYEANGIVHVMEAILSVQPWFGFHQKGSTPEDIIIKNLTKPLCNWRYEMFDIVFETEQKTELPKKMLDRFIHGSGKFMIEQLFTCFIKVRKECMSFSTMEKLDLPLYNFQWLKDAYHKFYEGTLSSLKFLEPPPARVPTVIKQTGNKLVTCNNCRRKEITSGTFTKCKACEEQKYPYPNFFCSDRCQSVWWEKEHMAQHLEFDLGLSDFTDCK